MTNNENELNNIISTEGASAPNTSDDGISINVVNRANGASDHVTVYPENTMEDIVRNCTAIGLTVADAPSYSFEYNGESTNDLNMRVDEMRLKDGSKLLVNPNGKVA